MKYIVSVREVHVCDYLVEADSPEHAKEIADTQGEEMYLEYSHRLGSEHTTVKEDTEA